MVFAQDDDEPTAEECENCKNALKTVDGQLPKSGKRTQQLVEKYLTDHCQNVLSKVPIQNIPNPLPIPVCSVFTAHRSDMVQGLVARKEYSAICEKANLC
ncbi:hypothetical protein DLAC_11399 [Tieghemostelium lacteum]|uniref:Saposin B-type domain-containing protein n=1 Tax=Tieghemostelium lacteum TaxID=361077 RepID=A0A151Z2H0_TIELA|nr:hypothetical protein DLAC_11399 [Tieghemostelium lacteum]|eukprot:KYQ88149.1 hypothetical protein DLAC_11399 [Tieghemostelium lacteum]